MAELPGLTLWIEPWQADTRHLSRAERGMYMDLIMEAWKQPSCDLPNDEKWLKRRLAASDEEWAEIGRPIIDEFWTLNGNGRLEQKRLKRERKFVEKKRQKQRVAAKSRWDKEKGACKRNANAMPITPTPTPTESEGKSTTETERIESPVERQGRSAPKAPPRDGLVRYAWQGRIIRLTQPDYDRWRKSYPDIPDFDAELQAADDYYHENPPADGKWFFPVSNWLKRANNNPSRPPGRVYDNPVADAQQQAKRLIYGDPPDDEPERDAASAQRSDQGVHPRDYPTLLESAPAYRA